MASILVAPAKTTSTTTSSTSNSNASSLTNTKQILCLKFVPQAFNTNKCQQCFNLKDLHSAEALAEFSKVC
jgi:hypothetical protein